jgi:hypothetical protein
MMTTSKITPRSAVIGLNRGVYLFVTGGLIELLVCLLALDVSVLLALIFDRLSTAPDKDGKTHDG